MKMHTLKSLGLGFIVLAYFAALESKSALGAFALNEGLSAWQHAALSVSCAILAFVFAKLAGIYACDVRPFVRAAATTARLVALCCIVVPTIYLATSNRHDRVEREWTAYHGSEAYEADLALVRDPMADAYEREAARERIVKPSAEVGVIEFLIALALQVLGVLAAGIPLHARATPEEVAHWRKVEAAKRGAITRKRNAAARKAKAKTRPKLVVNN